MLLTHSKRPSKIYNYYCFSIIFIYLLLINNNILAMNSAKTLYSILNLIIILILISIGLGILLFVVSYFTDLPINTSFNQQDLSSYPNDIALYIFMGLNILVYAVFIAGIWRLRQVTQLFIEHKFYTTALISKIGTAGKFFLLSGVFMWLINGLSNAYFKQEIKISIGEKTFVYLFIIAMGLFMMLIGSVIKDAKSLKEENGLTI